MKKINKLHVCLIIAGLIIIGLIIALFVSTNKVAVVSDIIIKKKKDSVSIVNQIKKDAKETNLSYDTGGINAALNRAGFKNTNIDSADGRPIALPLSKLDTTTQYIKGLKVQLAIKENRVAALAADSIIKSKIITELKNKIKVVYVNKIVKDTITKFRPGLIQNYIKGTSFIKEGDLKEFVTFSPVVRYNLTTRNFTPGLGIYYKNGRASLGAYGLYSNNTGKWFLSTDFTFDVFRYPISRKK